MKLVSSGPRRDDWKHRSLAVTLPFALLATFVAAVAGLFGGLTTPRPNAQPDPRYPYCSPDGQVKYWSGYYGDYAKDKYWDASMFLSVTLGFGGLSFAEAKAIDIAFDLIIGRGTQLLLAIAFYPILRRSFLCSLEVKGMQAGLLFPLYLDKISAGSLWALFRNSVKRRTKSDDESSSPQPRHRLDWRLILVFFIILYVLVTPNFLSAMTSYQATSVPWVKRPNSHDYLPATNFTIPPFVIEDGHRVGLTKYFPVTNSSQYYDTTSACMSNAAVAIAFQIAVLLTAGRLG